MLLERTSNELINKAFPGTVIRKPIPQPEQVRDAVQSLPLQTCLYQGILGTGDYDHSKSTGGSVVLGYEGEVVAKVPLGVVSGDVFKKAKYMQESVRRFSDISPKTMVIIAKADDEDPKPVVLQKTIVGKPLCETSLARVFRMKTLLDIKKIVHNMHDWYWEKGAYDLCGQKVSSSILGKILHFLPNLSDNIMISESGQAFLTDNILVSEVKVDTPVRKYKDFLRKQILHRIPIIMIDTLIFARKVYSFFRRENMSDTNILHQTS